MQLEVKILIRDYIISMLFCSSTIEKGRYDMLLFFLFAIKKFSKELKACASALGDMQCEFQKGHNEKSK
jgi:hypothetical protein